MEYLHAGASTKRRGPAIFHTLEECAKRSMIANASTDLIGPFAMHRHECYCS